jgi:hypothetical protein
MSWLRRNPTRNKKLTGLLRQEWVSPPPCPTPVKILLGRVQLGHSKKISESWRSFLIPTGVAKAVGVSHGSVTKFWNNLIFKID